MRALLVSLIALGVAFLSTPVLATTSASPGPDPGILSGAAILGPLGLNPLFALATLGAARFAGLGSSPPGLEFFEHPVMFVTLLILGGILALGKSSKLSKPVAEVAGLGETFIAFAAAVLIALPHFQSAGSAGSTELMKAGIGSGLLIVATGLSTVAVIMVARAAVSILVWLSPIPFIDGAFEVLKAILTFGLVALALVAPGFALIVNVVLLVATLLALRFVARAARFGLTVLYDLSLGRFGERIALPVDEVEPQDLGPFEVFALSVPGLKRRSRATLTLDAGRWFLEAPRSIGESKKIPLGEDNKATFTRRMAGLELELPNGRVLLPPRYRHLEQELAEHSGAQVTVRPRPLGIQPRAVRQVP